MKKFFLIILVSIFIIFIGCKKENKATKPVNKPALPANYEWEAQKLFDRAQKIYLPRDKYTFFNPVRDFDRAINLYRKILTEYPKSSIADQAQWFLARANEDKIKLYNSQEYKMFQEIAVTEEELRTENILKRLKPYDPAISEYRKLIEKYPNSDFSVRAQFRIAELLSYELNPSRDFVRAIEEYRKLRVNYKYSGYYEYSLLRIGDCYRYLKNYKKAIATYEQLIQESPFSEYAIDAKSRINRLRRILAGEENSQDEDIQGNKYTKESD